MNDLIKITSLVSVIAVASCSSPVIQNLIGVDARQAEPSNAVITDEAEAVAPPEDASTAEEFDTTSQDERAEALAVPEITALELGTTLATLGDPSDPGLWMKTPLVVEVMQGRVAYQDIEITLELRPSGGDAGSGSQLSLSAMRLLDIPLTSVAEVVVSGL